jgi:hypothetical protein
MGIHECCKQVDHMLAASSLVDGIGYEQTVYCLAPREYSMDRRLSIPIQTQ